MATTSKRCRSCFIFAKPKYAHFCTGSCHRDAWKTFTINCWRWVFHLAITSHPAAVNWRQGERKPNSLLYKHIRHYHLIQAKPDVIKQESCNPSTFLPNVSRTAPLFSHNPSRNRQCNQAELPMKSIRYTYLPGNLRDAGERISGDLPRHRPQRFRLCLQAGRL